MCSSVEKMFALPRSCRCRLQNLLRTHNHTQFVVLWVSMQSDCFCFKSSNALGTRWNFSSLNKTLGFVMFWCKSRTLKETIKMMLCSSLTQGGLQPKYAVQIASAKSPQLTA